MSASTRKLLAILAIIIVACSSVAAYAAYTYLTPTGQAGLKTIKFQDEQTYNLADIPQDNIASRRRNITMFQWQPSFPTSEVLEVHGQFEYSLASGTAEGYSAGFQVFLLINSQAYQVATFECVQTEQQWHTQSFDEEVYLQNHGRYDLVFQLRLMYPKEASAPAVLVLVRDIQLSLVVSEG